MKMHSKKSVPPSQPGGAWELIRAAREKQPLESGEEKGKEGQDWWLSPFKKQCVEIALGLSFFSLLLQIHTQEIFFPTLKFALLHYHGKVIIVRSDRDTDLNLI